MNLARRILYQSFMKAVRLKQRISLDFRVWGRENLIPGAKICVVNHVTSSDAFAVMSLFDYPVHVVVGPGYASPWTARLLDAFEQINALTDHRTMVNSAVAHLSRGRTVCIAPEGDIQPNFQLGTFYPGVSAIWRRHPVPLVPIGIVAPVSGMREYPTKATMIGGRTYRLVKTVRGPYCINIGAPFMPDVAALNKKEQNEKMAAELRARIASLVEDVRMNKFWGR